MVRKKYARRKRRNNLSALSFPTYAWSRSFQKERQFVRFFQTLGLFSTLACSADVSVFARKKLGLANSANVGIGSCSLSRTILTHFTSKSQEALFLSPRLPNNSHTLLTTTNLPAIAKVVEAGPGAVLFDNLLYPVDVAAPDAKAELLTLVSSVSSLSVEHTKAVRSVIVTLSLLHLFDQGRS